MNYDEEKYEESLKFKPEGFFDGSGKLIEEDKILGYGFGRQCGRTFTLPLHAPLIHRLIWHDLCWEERRKFYCIYALFLSYYYTNLSKARDSHGTKAKDTQGCEIEINNEFNDFGAAR